MQEFLNKIRKIEVKIRTAIDSHKHGNFKSIFKGVGIEFEDVRTYQYGDDVRSIDWNVSAKGHGTFVKTFQEDKEQNIYFVVDVSASLITGNQYKKKLQLAQEITAVLAYSAMRQNSNIALVAFSDQKEKYLKPEAGAKHFYSFLNQLLTLESKSSGTNLQAAIGFLASIIKKKSVVFLISDFIDFGFEKSLSALAKKHDLIVLHLEDELDFKVPKLGIIPVFDLEKKKTTWINTSSRQLGKDFKIQFEKRKEILFDICKQNKATFESISTQEDFVPKLIKLFKTRNIK